MTKIQGFSKRVGSPTLDLFKLLKIRIYEMSMEVTLVNNKPRNSSKTNRREVLRLVKQICQTIAEELGYELVDIEYIKEFGSYFLRVYIDKVGGVSTHDCEIMSEKLSTILDEKDPIKEAYYLEVSSPGLDRPLKNDKDFKRNLNKDIEISLYKAIDNKKNYEGTLIDFNENEIVIDGGQGNKIYLPKEALSSVRLAIKF